MAESNKFNKVITISREYGAGGRSIARALAEKLDLPWYDKDFVKITAEESGYSVEDIQKEGERLSKSSRVLNSILNNAASFSSSHDGIFEAQKQVILELSEKPCIIIGRCSNVILKEAGIPCFNIFLYADMETRMKRAEELGENEGMDIRKYVHKRDELRNTYYKTYTKHEMGDYHYYDICLNTGLLGYDKCLTLLLSILENE